MKNSTRLISGNPSSKKTAAAVLNSNFAKAKPAFWMRLVFAVLLFTSLGAGAQVSVLLNPTYGYTFLNTTTSYTALAGGTVLQTGTGINTDNVSGAIALPFTFTYNGIKENVIYVSNNGFITFASAPVIANYSPLSNTTTTGYDGAIAGTGMNCVASTATGAAPEIRYGSNGTGDFVVQFQDIGQSSFAAIRMTYQIVLKADGKTVQIVYGPNNAGVAGAGQAQVGLRGTNDEDWNNRTVSSGGNWNTTGGAAGTANTSAMSLTATTVLPTSGRTFQWTPTAYTPTYLANAGGVSQEFTTWVNGSGPLNVPSTNWATNGYGNASWQIDNRTATSTTSGWSSTGGAYSPVDYASAVGGRSARFHSFEANIPQVGYLDYYVDLSAITGTPTLNFFTINPSGTDILQVFLSSDGGTTFTQLGSNIGVSTTWTSRSVSLGATNSATTIIRFKATSDFGNDDIGIDHVVIAPPPVLPTITSIAPNTNLCANGGQTITISGTNFSGTTSVTFNGVNAASFTVVNNTSITAVTPGGLTAGTIDVTNPAGTATSSAYTVAANPVVTISPSSSTVCSPGGTAVSLTASGAATYTWSPAAGLTPTTGATVSALPTVTTTYTATGTDANGCVGTGTALVTVAANPTGVSASATPATICSGTTAQLSSTVSPILASTYSFAGSPGTYTAITGTTLGAAAIGDDVGVGNLSIGFSFIYNGNTFSVFGARSNGLIELGQTAATLSGFSSNALASTANCIAPLWDDNNTTGGSIIYTTTGTTPNRILTVQWTGMHVGNGGSATQPTINMQVKLYEGTNAIDFVYGTTSAAFTTTTASIGISGAAGNFVSVTPLNPPSASTKSTTTENTNISSAANFPTGTTYSFTPASYTFSWAPAGDVVSPTSQNTLTNPLTATETFTVTVSNGGCSVNASTTVTVSAGATITSDPSPVTVCTGATATFTVVATGPGLTYQWRKNGIDIPIGGNASAGTATFTLTNVTAADNATYDVVVTATCGAPLTSAGATLTVNPVPTASASSNSPVCTESSLNLTGTTDIGTTFAWTGPNSFTSTLQNPVISPVTTAAAGTYTFTATLNGCTSVPATTVVVVNQTPTVPTVTPATATTICLGASQALTALSAAIPVNLLTQNFNAGLGSWTIANGTGHTAGTEWQIKTPPYTYSTSIVNSNGANGSNFIVANSDLSGAAANLTVTRLVSPVFSTTGVTGVTITFSHFLRALSETFVGVEYTINGGTTWTVVTGGTFTNTSTTSASSTTPPFANVSLTLNAAALNQAAVQIRFRYDASYDYYWGIDNIAVNGQGSPNYTWSASPATGAGLPASAATPLSTNSSITATPTLTGAYTYSAVATNAANGCTSAAGTTGLVTVNPNYTIAASAGPNGTITPNGVTTVSCDGTGSQTYTITPDACYAIADVLVDGVSNPGAIATGTYTFSSVTADHTISATFVLTTFTITATSGANGTVTPTGATTVNCGANATYTITPDAGYVIDDVLVDGVSNPGAVSAGVYTFINVTADHTISATFVQNTFAITSSAGANGTISPLGVTNVAAGANQTYTITPDACYSVADVVVDGQSVGAMPSYTFTNVQATHTISATFVLNTYTITATAGANGTIIPGTGSVNCGDDATYTITPNACYAIASVVVDGVSQGAVSSFTFTNVSADHSISATFALINYTITVSATGGGTVTPGTGTVGCGSDATYTINAPACYSIVDVVVDNQSVGAVPTYTFTNVTANHTISASFALNGPYTIAATSGANGTVTPAGNNSVPCGTDNEFTITPDACYSIADVLVDGQSVGAISTYTFTDVQANHTISATFVINTFTITATSGANGTVTPAGVSTVNCGSDATYTITPAAGYNIADVLVDGQSVGALATFTFTNVQTSHTISATFIQGAFTISASAGTGGTITPSGSISVTAGDDQTFTIAAATCYTLADVLVDGQSVGAVPTYTFTNVQTSHTIAASFTLNGPYTITATSGANGTVTPAGASTVACGANATYTITPASCYGVADVLVDGQSVGAVTTYTFTNVQTSHTISATFVATAPAATPVVTGITNVCPYIGTGQQITYTATSAGATSFQWTIPANTTAVGPTNGSSITLTFQTGFASQANKQLRVRGLSACGNSAQVIFYLVAQYPPTPQSISGPTNVCPILGTNNTYTYTVPPVAEATGYNWTAQAGTTIVTSNGTSATVQFLSGFTTSNITVAATNGCGVSGIRNLTVQRVNPGTPGLISGPTNSCPYIAPGGATATYSIVDVPNAVSYTWTVPQGSIGLTGQGTTSISFTYPAGYTGGSISVTATNNCGTSAPRSLTITKQNAGVPSQIDVIQAADCPNRVYTYSVSGLPPSATSIQWSVPAGGTITSGQGSTSITVSYVSTTITGNVVAQGVNNCSISNGRTTAVRLPACPPGSPVMFSKAGATQVTSGTESLSVQVSPNPTTTDFRLKVTASGTERITVRILDMQGRSYKTFTATAQQSTRIGADLKAGAYILEVRQGNVVRTEKLLKF